MPYEIYLPIEGYEDTYAVSNLGRVKNIRTGKILSMRKNNWGYMQIDLYKEGKAKTYLVHRLVLTAFKANSDNKPCVNHRDENKENNNVNNLEWVTPLQNNTYNDRHLKVGEKNKIKIICIELNKLFDSAKDAALWLNKPEGHSDITKCCKNRRKSAYGYTWKYADDSEGDVE